MNGGEVKQKPDSFYDAHRFTKKEGHLFYFLMAPLARLEPNDTVTSFAHGIASLLSAKPPLFLTSFGEAAMVENPTRE